jgi:phage shock protein A
MDPQLVTLIIALAGSIGSVLAFVAGRRERAASAASSEGSAAALISEGYMNLVDRLEKRVARLEEENKELRICVTNLEDEKEDARIDFEKQISQLKRKVGQIDDALTNGGNGS